MGERSIAAVERALALDPELAPAHALRISLQDAADNAGDGARMQGYVVEVTSLDAVELPREILKQPGLRLAMGITHYKPPGAAWAQLVVVFVFVAAAMTET